MFRNWLESSAGIDALVSLLMQNNPGLRLSAYESKEKIELMQIEVPEAMRGRGTGTEVIRSLQDYARSVGKPIVLRPEADRGRKGDLDRFYKGLGFVHNRGRHTDFVLSSPTSRTMYWRPRLDEGVRVTDKWPVNKLYYDMESPEGRKEYEDDLRRRLSELEKTPRRLVSERVVSEPYTITCWRGFNGFAYGRDVSREGERIFIDSSKAMQGILWFAHSLQSRRHLDGLSPEEFALTYAKDHDEKYLLKYPLHCTMAYKSVKYDDGQEYVEFAEGLGTEWTRIENKSYLLPKGWFITWQNQEYMAFKGILEINDSMLRKVTT